MDTVLTMITWLIGKAAESGAGFFLMGSWISAGNSRRVNKIGMKKEKVICFANGGSLFYGLHAMGTL